MVPLSQRGCQKRKRKRKRGGGRRSWLAWRYVSTNKYKKVSKATDTVQSIVHSSRSENVFFYSWGLYWQTAGLGFPESAAGGVKWRVWPEDKMENHAEREKCEGGKRLLLSTLNRLFLFIFSCLLKSLIWTQLLHTTSHLVLHNSHPLDLASRLCAQPVHKTAAEGIYQKKCMLLNKIINYTTIKSDHSWTSWNVLET